MFHEASLLLKDLNFTIIKEDKNRPWGGFYVIDELQAEQFADLFFPGEDAASLRIAGRLSPKLLMVAPGKRLSWQYHRRRAEIWRCVKGEVAVATSDTDHEEAKHILRPGDIIRLAQGKRHRLIGLDEWGIVAEIWQHTDADNPSDEDDIVRLQDDFGRSPQ